MSLLVMIGITWAALSAGLLALVTGVCRAGHAEDVARGYVDSLG